MEKMFVGKLFHEQKGNKVLEGINNSWCVVSMKNSTTGLQEITLHQSGTYFIAIRFDRTAQFYYVGEDGTWSNWSSVPQNVMDMCSAIINAYF